MPTTNSGAAARVTLRGDRELVITREFDAPRKLVFEALTRPEHVKRWYGLRGSTLSVCEIDLRVGGAWRYVVRDPGGNEYAFSGVYREIVAPERVVSTEGFEAMPGHDYVVTMTLEETGGRTKLTSRLLYQSAEDRTGHLQSGMEPGMNETFDRLAELLAGMARPRV
jgi:uncharacterized protein YndB with AHSA1/START domain